MIEGHLRQSLGRVVAVFGGHVRGRSGEPGGGEGGVLGGLAPEHVDYGDVEAAGHCTIFFIS